MVRMLEAAKKAAQGAAIALMLWGSTAKADIIPLWSRNTPRPEAVSVLQVAKGHVWAEGREVKVEKVRTCPTWMLRALCVETSDKVFALDADEAEKFRLAFFR